jgi:hypothetical protein
LSIGFAMKFTSNQACIQNKTAKNKNKKILLRLIYDKLVQHANVSIHQGPKTLRHMVHKCCLHFESINPVHFDTPTCQIPALQGVPDMT